MERHWISAQFFLCCFERFELSFKRTCPIFAHLFLFRHIMAWHLQTTKNNCQYSTISSHFGILVSYSNEISFQNCRPRSSFAHHFRPKNINIYCCGIYFFFSPKCFVTFTRFLTPHQSFVNKLFFLFFVIVAVTHKSILCSPFMLHVPHFCCKYHSCCCCSIAQNAFSSSVIDHSPITPCIVCSSTHHRHQHHQSNTAP